MVDEALLGTDLRVVLGPPGLAAYDASALDVRERRTPAQRSAAAASGEDAALEQGFRPEPPGASELSDLDTIAGRHNVGQALILRLLTPKGALAPLGHASYGSRLGELIGKNKTEALRGLCRAYLLEAIREEPRVEDKPLAITFDPAREQPWDFVVEIVVQPVSGGEPVSVEVQVAL
jgi:hypothetical protein